MLQFVISTHLVYYLIVVTLICIGCDTKVSREVISLRFRDSFTNDCFVWRVLVVCKGYQLILIKSLSSENLKGLVVLGRTSINFLCLFSHPFISFTSFAIYLR